MSFAVGCSTLENARGAKTSKVFNLRAIFDIEGIIQKGFRELGDHRSAVGIVGVAASVNLLIVVKQVSVGIHRVRIGHVDIDFISITEGISIRIVCDGIGAGVGGINKSSGVGFDIIIQAIHVGIG